MRDGAHKHSPMPGSLVDWNPGLDNGAQTLRSVYDCIPREYAPAIPWYVKMLENPASPIALAGAVDVVAHDCIHILLGRGTLAQDEAFVIGFTMGASGTLSPLQHRLFAFCARFIYRDSYRFSPIDRMVFDIAVDVAVRMKTVPLDRVEFGPLMDQSIGKIRAALAIDPIELVAAYEQERNLWPTSPAAQRLPRAPAKSPNALPSRERVRGPD
jgi:hypothetical protein